MPASFAAVVVAADGDATSTAILAEAGREAARSAAAAVGDPLDGALILAERAAIGAIDTHPPYVWVRR